MNYLLPVISIASIYAFRMLGLFMILPVFATLASQYTGSSPALIGSALGAYGLTQALLQMPFGVLSDRIGRKTVIALGLLLFAIGSAIAALATDIHTVIIGRALQGAGAIGSTLLAFVADVTSPEKRNQAMAIIGASIGGSFAIAMVLGPLLSDWIGLSGLFWVTSVLAGVGLVSLFTIVPSPKAQTEQLGSTFKQIKKVLTSTDLLRLNYGIFAQHAILTASFVVIPKLLSHVSSANQWKLYCSIMFIAFLGILKLNLFKRADHQKISLVALLFILLSQIALFLQTFSTVLLVGFLFVFFFGFTILEVALPSQVSKTAPSNSRGTAMGVYSSCQFLGIFFGGSIAGLLHHHFGVQSVFALTTLLALSWMIFSHSGIAYLKQVNTIDG